MSAGATPCVKKSNGKYLWWSLLSQGFESDAAAAHLKRTNVKHIQLGIDMFDKPNKDAFYLVSHFLLEKLNPTRFHDSYRHCWPVLDHQADAKFRKITCAWLREIMDENGSGGPKVVASLFLSPGGAKFVNLMLHLAIYVKLQEIKKCTTDGSWVPETAAMTTSSLHMSRNRFKLTRARFLKYCVEQDHLLREYQRRAQTIVKSSRDNRAELAKYEHLKRHHVDAAQDGVSLELKTQKVRALWLAFDGMLAAIKEEWRVTDCVTRGDVDQYCLDGRDVTLKLSRVLLDRIEQLPQHLSTGNLYEGGQLNLLCVLELMNHALQLLREEWNRTGASLPQINPQPLEGKRLQMARVLDDLMLMRHKITKEEVPKIRSDIKKLDLEWDRKWGALQGSCPLTSFLNEEPALAFLSPMAPLSFDVGNDASYRDNIFSQYPAKLLDAETKSQRSTTMSMDSDLESIRSPPVERAETPVATTDMLLQGNTSLRDFLETTSPLLVKTTPLPQQLQQEKVSVRKTALPRPKLSAVEKKVHILDRECDNLADQFADAVTTDGRTKGLDLEDLLITMGGDPFSTRKQLPRTPESLILDVKSSWRKAVQAKSVELSTLEEDSLRGTLFSPLAETDEVFGHPETPSSSQSPASATTLHQQQGVSQSMFTPTGDSSDMEALFGPIGTGSGVEDAHFSLHHETLPVGMDGDSMLSLGDDGQVFSGDSIDTEEDDDDELLLPDIPSLTMEARRTPLAARQHVDRIQQACSDSSFMDNGKQKATPDRLLSRHASHLSHIMESPMATGQVFSLDLDSLENHSPPSEQEFNLPNLVMFSPLESGSPPGQKEYSLPKLVTFSPIDDI